LWSSETAYFFLMTIVKFNESLIEMSGVKAVKVSFAFGKVPEWIERNE
jgi:hypothetical protein